MSGPQPEYVWQFPPERRRTGRIWLITGLVIAALAIAVAIFLLFVRPGAPMEPASTASPSPTASASASASATDAPSADASPAPASPAPSSSAAPAPQPAPSTEPPAPADPELPVFRDRVQPRLDDADTGLSFASELSGQEGVQLVDELQGDAANLADTAAPQTISAEWSRRVSAYSAALDGLRRAFETDASVTPALSEARSALEDLNRLIAG